MTIAMTRPVSPSIVRCELTHLARAPIDVGRAELQHAAYVWMLGSLGVKLVNVPAAPELPDAVFIEDTAIVLDEIAIVTRPGAESRRAETPAVAAALAAHRPVRAMTSPATLDGGDVLRLGRTLYVGRSSRTNDRGIEALRDFLSPLGYRVVAVEFSGCLHLKSAVTALADDLLLMNRGWVTPADFPDGEAILVDEAEPYAANALRVGDTILHPEEFPRTRERLLARGLEVATVACDEIAKAEGAVTCCCLLFEETASEQG